MTFTTIYKSILAIAIVGLFTMCKSDADSSKTKKIPEGKSIDIKIDSSMVDLSHTTDLAYVSLPHMHRWNLISNSLLKLNNNPSGYEVIDTISWTHPNGKSYMSMSHYSKTNTEITDYNMFYEKLKSSYPYTEYSYTKYNVGEILMHEIKLINDKTYNYKLIIPKGNEIVSIDLQAYDDGRNVEVINFIDQIPALVTIR